MGKKCSILSITAILLWVLGAGFVAYRMVAGDISGINAGRVTIQLKPEEREFVLLEMRTMLSSVHGMVQGLSRNNMDQVAESARASGMAMAADVNPALMMKLPLDFKTRGIDVHKKFDEFVGRSEKNPDSQEALKFLDAQLERCIACHAAYQLLPEK